MREMEGSLELELAGENEVFEGKLPQSHTALHKHHVNRPGTELGPAAVRSRINNECLD
jgi:hypothetical protein